MFNEKNAMIFYGQYHNKGFFEQSSLEPRDIEIVVLMHTFVHMQQPINSYIHQSQNALNDVVDKMN